MNDQIRTAYREVAAQARDYADPGRAVATARRRRRRTRAAALIVPAVAAVLGAGVLLRPARAPDLTPISVLDPAVLTPPTTPRSLPTGGTGPAALVYSTCFSGCPTLVAFADGRQFTMPRAVWAGATSLSPDGRWLGFPRDGAYLVRDLTGVGVHRIQPAGPGRVLSARAWSADSATLLLGDEPAAGGDARYRLLDVVTGTTTTLSIPDGARAAGVLPDGSVLYRPATAAGATLALAAIGGRPYPIALGDKLAAGERVQSVHVARDGRHVWIVVGKPHDEVATADGQPAAVLLAALSGGVRARYELPAGGWWATLGPSDDGFVLSHRPDTAARVTATLVTVSAAGAHDGLAVPGTEGGAVVRLPG